MIDLSQVIVAIIALGGPTLMYFQNKSNNKRLSAVDGHTNDLDKIKTDAQALDRAKLVYEDLIKALESQAVRLKEEIHELEIDLNDERKVNDGLRMKLRELESLNDHLDDNLRDAKLELARVKTELAKLETK